MTSTSGYNFTDLNELLGKTIGKIGLVNAIELLKGIADDKSIEVDHRENIRLITFYIVSRCLAIFDLREGEFNLSSIPEYRDGRMACYHLLRKYTISSYALIAQHFSQKKRNVMYFCQKCDEMLSVPQFHREFASKYKTLESQTIDFIGKLKSTDANEKSKQ